MSMDISMIKRILIYYRDKNSNVQFGIYNMKTDCCTFVYVDNDGHVQLYDCDKKGNKIHYRNTDNLEEWADYDENGNVIHYINNDGYEEWASYDENGNMIYYKNSDGDEETLQYEV